VKNSHKSNQKVRLFLLTTSFVMCPKSVLKESLKYCKSFREPTKNFGDIVATQFDSIEMGEYTPIQKDILLAVSILNGLVTCNFTWIYTNPSKLLRLVQSTIH
jgi:hypothetical protein